MGLESEDFEGDDFMRGISSPIEQYNKATTEAYVESSNRISQPLVTKGGRSRYIPTPKESHDYLGENEPVRTPTNPEYPSHKINYLRPPKPRVHFSNPMSRQRLFSIPEKGYRNSMNQQQTRYGDSEQNETNQQYQTNHATQSQSATPHIESRSAPYPPPYSYPWLPSGEQAYTMNESPHSEDSSREAEIPKVDPEKIRLEAEIKAFKAAEEKIKAQERQREVEAQIRKDVEEELLLKMETRPEAEEDARKELKKVREEAERSVAEKMEKERFEEEKKTAELNAYRTRFEEDLKRKLDMERLSELEKRAVRNTHFEEFGELFKRMLNGIEEIIALTKEKTRLEIEQEKEMMQERHTETKQLLFEIREELKAERDSKCGQCSSMESTAPESRPWPRAYQDDTSYLTISSSVTASSARHQGDDWSLQADSPWSPRRLSVPEPPGTPDSSFSYETARESSIHPSDEPTSPNEVDLTTRSHSPQHQGHREDLYSKSDITEIEDTVNRIVDAFVRRLTGPICWDVGNSPAPRPWQYQKRRPVRRRPSYISESSSSFSDSSFEGEEEPIIRSRSRRRRIRPTSSNHSFNSYHKAYWRKRRVRENRMRPRSNIRLSPEIEEATHQGDDPTATECDLPSAPEPPSSLNGIIMGTETSDCMASEAETNMAHAGSDLENSPPKALAEEKGVHGTELLTLTDSEISATKPAAQYLLEDYAPNDKGELENFLLAPSGIKPTGGILETDVSKMVVTVISEACGSPDDSNEKDHEKRLRKTTRSQSSGDARSKESLDAPHDDGKLQLFDVPQMIPNFWGRSFIRRPLLLSYKQTTNVWDLAIPRLVSRAKHAIASGDGEAVAMRLSTSTVEIECVD